MKKLEAQQLYSGRLAFVLYYTCTYTTVCRRELQAPISMHNAFHLIAVASLQLFFHYTVSFLADTLIWSSSSTLNKENHACFEVFTHKKFLHWSCEMTDLLLPSNFTKDWAII